MIAEAIETLDDYRRFSESLSVPILANLTEFGKTPCFAMDELQRAGVGMVLFPLTAFRAMNEAARRTYEAIRRDGNQRAILDTLQSRDQLYELLHYHEAEQRLDLGKKQ